MQAENVQAVLNEAGQLDFAVALPPQKKKNPFRPVLICVAKNELEHLPAFLQHYRDRGVQEFVFLDNSSTDGTPAFLDAQPDVFLATVRRPFNWQNKQGWIHHAIRSIGLHRWFLVVDADERVVFPGEEQHDLADLAAAMQAQGHWRVRGLLVDMYPRGPLSGSPGQEHELFDRQGYRQSIGKRMVSVRGGPRSRRLSSAGFKLEPELSKYPLFRLEEDELMVNPHHLWPFERNFSAPCHLGILHYKFSDLFAGKLERVIEEGVYWKNSFEYRAYQAALCADPQLSLEYEGSCAYRSPQDLVDLGLIDPVNWSSARLQRLWRQLRRRPGTY